MSTKAKTKKQYLAIIAAIILLGTFVLPSLARAEDPPLPTEAIIIKPEDLKKANTSVDECQKFRDKLFNATHQEYKAIWPLRYRKTDTGRVEEPIPTEFGAKCYIVPALFPDFKYNGKDILGSHGQQPQGAKNLQATLENGKGLNSNDILKAHLADEEAKIQANGISKIIGWLLNLLLSVVTSIIGILTSIVGQIFVYAVRWTTEVTVMPDIVNVGWAIVRDFANLFFILIMIVIAIAAILRIEEYDYRHLLGEVIIMAILVNFSKVIAVTLINFVNYIVSIFAVDSLSQIIAFLWNVSWGGITSLPGGGWMSALVQGFTKVIFMIVALGCFVALTGLFVVRLVGLYILVIFSPMAYVLDILPATKKVAHQWWHKFIEYLIWAPVSMFMLRLAILIVENKGLGNSNVASDSTFNYVLLTGFLVGAVIIGEHAGMVGAKAAVTLGEKAGHHYGEFVGRTYSKYAMNKQKNASARGQTIRAGAWRAAAFLNPQVAKKAWDARAKELEEDVIEPAAGYARDSLNRYFPTEWHGWGNLIKDPAHFTLGRKTNYGAIEYNKVINHKVKEFNEAPLTEEQRVRLFVDATHLEDKLALLRSIVMNRHEDGLAGAWGVPYNWVDFQKRMIKALKESGASDETIGEQMNYVSEIAEEGRKLRGLGSGVVDTDANGKEHARAAADLSIVFQKTDQQLVDYLKLRGVIDDQNQFLDSKGNVVRDASGADVVINSQADLKNFIRTTSNLDDANGEILENEIIAARGAAEAYKRAKRTDNEDIAKAIEPAAFMVQELDGTWSRYHSYGRRFAPKLDPAVGTSLPNMRRTVGRAMALVGMVPGPDGQIDIRALDPNQSQFDQRKFDMLVETSYRWNEAAAGFLNKIKIKEQSIAEDIARAVNARMRQLGYQNVNKELSVDGNAKNGEWFKTDHL